VEVDVGVDREGGDGDEPQDPPQDAHRVRRRRSPSTAEITTSGLRESPRMAVELATSAWADDLLLTVVGFDTLATGRVRHVPDVAELIRG
jgi:hypothetical protein